jgi:hypothetical protein
MLNGDTSLAMVQYTALHRFLNKTIKVKRGHLHYTATVGNIFETLVVE